MEAEASGSALGPALFVGLSIFALVTQGEPEVDPNPTSRTEAVAFDDRLGPKTLSAPLFAQWGSSPDASPEVLLARLSGATVLDAEAVASLPPERPALHTTVPSAFGDGGVARSMSYGRQNAARVTPEAAPAPSMDQRAGSDQLSGPTKLETALFPQLLPERRPGSLATAPAFGVSELALSQAYGRAATQQAARPGWLPLTLLSQAPRSGGAVPQPAKPPRRPDLTEGIRDASLREEVRALAWERSRADGSLARLTASDLPPAPPAQSYRPRPGPIWFRLTGDRVHLRDAPSLTARPIDLFDSGRFAEVSGADGRWLLVEIEGQTGWMWSAYLVPVAPE